MSGKIIEYTTVCGPLNAYFHDRVNKLLKEGWKLWYAPVMDTHGYIVQAMVKEEA